VCKTISLGKDWYLSSAVVVSYLIVVKVVVIIQIKKPAAA
jgi:hypothetical protein